MDFTAVIASLLRRWYLALGGLLVTAGLVAAALYLVPPSYSATASVVLLPSQQSLQAGANPLLQLGGLDQPTSLAVAYLGGSDLHRRFGEMYPGATYTATVDTLGRGPLVDFTVDAPTADGALTALQGALAMLPQALNTLQDGVDAPAASRVRSAPLSVDTHATKVKGTTMRVAILAAGVGLALTLIGAVAFDSLIARRSARRSKGTDEPQGDGEVRDTLPITLRPAPRQAGEAAPGFPPDWAGRPAAPHR